MSDPGAAALVLVVRIVHIARLDPSRTVDIAGDIAADIAADIDEAVSALGSVQT
ncbi:hypothetical protein GCM10010305_03130 [Streptomyces termitum]|uniref:Uncharacterized protein n=1 Tax=Streptomyces termitum TaxID=67368 RepID=A0A918W3W3_9ACTN|nr:hypothetical protein GCM10010305_03130 [Streptomyces termitum]